jgi:excisionase family DNA binding protein
MTITAVHEFYTPEQVAALLQVKRATVYGWIRTKKLAARKAGRKVYRITPTDIEEFLKK